MKKGFVFLVAILSFILTGCGCSGETKEDREIRKELIRGQLYQLNSSTIGDYIEESYAFNDDYTYFYFVADLGYKEKVDRPCDFMYGKWEIKNKKLILKENKKLCMENVFWEQNSYGNYAPDGDIIYEKVETKELPITINDNYIEFDGKKWYKFSVPVKSVDDVKELIVNHDGIPRVKNMID